MLPDVFKFPLDFHGQFAIPLSFGKLHFSALQSPWWGSFGPFNDSAIRRVLPNQNGFTSSHWRGENSRVGRKEKGKRKCNGEPEHVFCFVYLYNVSDKFESLHPDTQVTKHSSEGIHPGLKTEKSKIVASQKGPMSSKKLQRSLSTSVLYRFCKIESKRSASFFYWL